MKRHCFKKHTIVFPSEYYEEICSYLRRKTVSDKRILIPVKAYPFPSKGIEKMFFLCELEQGKTSSKLMWKSRFFLPEAIAVAIFLLMCICGLIQSVSNQLLNKPVSVIFVLFVSSFVFFVIIYYYCLYRYCNKKFVKDITAKIETIRR